MSIEITKDNFAPLPDNSEGLRFQVFNPGDRQSMMAGDLNHSEVIAKNDLLIKEIQAQVTRIAEATVKRVSALPEPWQEHFYNGISCYKGNADELVYAAVFKQREISARQSV